MPRNLRDSAERHFQKALILMKNGKYKEALKVLKKAEETASKAGAYDLFLYIQTVKGQLMQDSGEYEEAMKVHFFILTNTEKLLSEEPYNEFYLQIVQMSLKSVFALGNVFHKMGRFSEAKSCFELNLLVFYQLLKIEPNNLANQLYVAGTFNNLGAVLSDMGQVEEAIDLHEKALAIYEKNPRNGS